MLAWINSLREGQSMPINATAAGFTLRQPQCWRYEFGHGAGSLGVHQAFQHAVIRACVGRTVSEGQSTGVDATVLAVVYSAPTAKESNVNSNECQNMRL